MARFTLVVRPDGKAVLVCNEPLNDRQASEIHAAVGEWTHVGGPDVLVLPECDVVQVVDLEIGFGPGAPAEVA